MTYLCISYSVARIRDVCKTRKDRGNNGRRDKKKEEEQIVGRTILIRHLGSDSQA